MIWGFGQMAGDSVRARAALAPLAQVEGWGSLRAVARVHLGKQGESSTDAAPTELVMNKGPP